jgi:hypothetical protein
MKKLVLAASMLAVSFGVFAQDYKPVAGDVTAELSLTGGIAITEPDLNQSGFPATPNLRFRYFLQDQMALRVGFNFSSYGDRTNIYEATPGTGEGFAKYKSSIFNLNLGLEKHLVGTDRLSTYVGADLLLRKTGASDVWDNTNNGITFSNGDSRKRTGVNTNGDVASFGFGLRGVVGGEYYFIEKVYLGAEFGWGFTAIKEGKVKDEITSGGTTTTVETNSQGSQFELAPNLTAGVRLGFRF